MFFESPDFVIFRMRSGFISTLYCSGCAWGRLLLWLAELYHFESCRFMFRFCELLLHSHLALFPIHSGFSWELYFCSVFVLM